MKTCETCKGEIINAEFILDELTTLGYMKTYFCRRKCFIIYIVKKFKRRIKRELK